MGEGQDGRSDDPFEQLLDPGFVSRAAHQEPSADERRRAAEREARTADLKRRLAAEDAQRSVEERANRRSEGRARRKDKAKKALAFGLLAVVVGGAVWFESRSGPGVAAPRQPVGQADPVIPPESVRPSNFPPADKGASKTPLDKPPPAPPTPGAFEFLATQPKGSGPVAWDPCRPIRYVMNPAGAPPGGDELVREAMLLTAAASGLKFVEEGTTDEVWSKDREPYQPDKYGKKWAPVLVTWTTDQAAPDLAGYVVGFAGSKSFQVPDGRSAYVSGVVVLDAVDLPRILARPGGRTKARAVIQHELGHLVGLGHVAERSQLMFTESLDDQPAEWGTGDLAGLSQLGSGDCFPDL